MKLGNLAARVATAVVLVPPIVLTILWRRHWGFWIIIFAATLLSLNEYFGMTHKDRPAEERWFGVAAGAAAAALAYWRPWGPFVALPAAVIVPALYYLFRFRDMQTAASRMGMSAFGVVYAGVLLTFIAYQKRDMGWRWVILTLMIAWLGDTGAYFAGRFLGKTKLYPAVSPGKTWAGAFGGLAGSFLGAVVCNLWFFPQLGWVRGAILTIVGGALGQCGDLVESLLKRSCGVKDSGKLLPGHGGMLDRIDAILFVAPWVYLYALLGPH